MAPTPKDIEAAEKLVKTMLDEHEVSGFVSRAAQALAASREEGREQAAKHISAYDFVLGADANALLEVLNRTKCKDCGGTGELLDAEPGDISFNSWVCKSCDGKGWNKQAVTEIIDAAGPAPHQSAIRNIPTKLPPDTEATKLSTQKE